MFLFVTYVKSGMVKWSTEGKLNFRDFNNWFMQILTKLYQMKNLII